MIKYELVEVSTLKSVFEEIPYLEGQSIIIKKVEKKDAPELDRLRKNEYVNKRVPTFLFEKRYDDINYVIDHLYDECLKESVILGVYRKSDMTFCGLCEFYGFNDELQKISVGCRLLEEKCGKGFGTETARLMVEHLTNNTDIKIITASILADNIPSQRAVEKAGFKLVNASSEEDFGFGEPSIVTKWVY